MDNTQQLPAEVVVEINKKAEDYMGYIDMSSASYSDIEPYEVKDAWKAGATEYATKLHQAQQEIVILKQWKEEAKQLLNLVWDFADNNIEVKPGKCKIGAVVEHAQNATELVHEALVHIEYLENKFNIVTGSGNNLKSRLQTFLDGTK